MVSLLHDPPLYAHTQFFQTLLGLELPGERGLGTPSLDFLRTLSGVRDQRAGLRDSVWGGGGLRYLCSNYLWHMFGSGLFGPHPQYGWNFPWVLPEDYCKKDPCNLNTEMCVSKVGQPLSNSSTSSQPGFVRAFGGRKTVRNRQGKILYTELLKSWPTLGPLLANSPPHGKLQGSSLQ